MIKVIPSNFEQVAPAWEKYLWDNRYKFEATSCMLYLGGYDGQIAEKYKPFFWTAFLDGQMAGVVSGHATSAEHFRLRGLCVLPNYRNKGCASTLIGAVVEEARNQSFQLVWTAPRQHSLGIFQNLGFKKTSDFTNEGFMFGPNCYAALKI
jgi:GNAT superfamily N-acetyltransferase